MAIKAKISVDNSELKQGMKDAEKTASNSMDKITKGAESASGGFKGILSVLKSFGPWGRVAALAIGGIVAAVIGVISVINKLSNKMDDIAKRAKSMDLSTNAYQDLTYAAKLSGVEMEKIEKLISTINFKIAQVNKGSLEAAKGFTELGISWTELAKQTPEKQLLTVIEASEKIKNLTTRNNALFKLFPKEDVNDLKKLINADFGRQVASAKLMGVVIDEDKIRVAEKYNDVLDTTNQQMVAYAANLEATEKAMETIERVTKKLSDNMVDDAGRVRKEYSDTYTSLQESVDEMMEKYNKDPKEQARMQERLSNIMLFKAMMPFGNEVTLNMSDKKVKEEREKSLRDLYAQEAQTKDPRFNISDPTTWVQKRLSPKENAALDPEKIKADNILLAVKSISLQLEEKKKKEIESLNLLNKELNVDREIEKIEKEIGKLTKEQRDEIKSSLMVYELERNRNILAQLEKANSQRENEFEIQKALLQKDTERAEKLKMINDLKEKGLSVTEKDLGDVDKKREIEEGKIKEQEKIVEENKKASEEYIKNKISVDENEKKLEDLNKSIDSYNNAIQEAKEGKRDPGIAQQFEENFTLAVETTDKDIKRIEKRLKLVGSSNENAQDLVADATNTALNIFGGSLKTFFTPFTYDNEMGIKQYEDELQKIYGEKLKVETELRNAQMYVDSNQGGANKSDEAQKKIEESKAKLEEIKVLEETNKKLEKQKKQKEELGSLTLKNNVAGQYEAMQTQAMKLAGLTKQAATYEALRNAEKTKGMRLNLAEIEQIQKLSDIQYGLSTMQMNKNAFNGTITNSLAQRGGFSSSVVRDDTRSVNQKIYENSKNQYIVLQEINRNIQGIGVIQ